MIIRAAVVPHPPLLVPELVTGAAAETEPLRSACVTAARRLAEVAPHWVAVATDPAGPAVVAPSARGSFAGYGVAVPVALTERADRDDPELPLPALVAGWLRARAGAASVRVHLLPPGLPPAECRRFGAELAAGDAVGLLILGDGSNRHTERAPARPDERAAGFDAGVRAALAAADPAALLALDPDLAAELGAPGRAAWQVLAGAAGDQPWRADLLYSGAPFGVGYHVAVWEPPAIG